jgi:hypothetical protein
LALLARVQRWARRPRCGETYGATYVDPFYDTITNLNARCNVEKNSKVSPDEVREQLLRLHPGKFCLPGVWAPQNFSLRWARRKQMAALVGVCAAVLPADVFRVVDEMVEGLPKSTLPSCLQQ